MIETHLRVRYAETDAMGVVHHASYLVWLELGRTDLLRAAGASYRSIEARGFSAPVTDLQARYHAAARYDDPITVQTWLTQVRSRQLQFAYHVRHAEHGTLLVRASTTHTIIAREHSAPARLPADLASLLDTFHRASPALS